MLRKKNKKIVLFKRGVNRFFGVEVVKKVFLRDRI